MSTIDLHYLFWEEFVKMTIVPVNKAALAFDIVDKSLDDGFIDGHFPSRIFSIF